MYIVPIEYMHHSSKYIYHILCELYVPQFPQNTCTTVLYISQFMWIICTIVHIEYMCHNSIYITVYVDYMYQQFLQNTCTTVLYISQFMWIICTIIPIEYMHHCSIYIYHSLCGLYVPQFLQNTCTTVIYITVYMNYMHHSSYRIHAPQLYIYITVYVDYMYHSSYRIHVPQFLQITYHSLCGVYIAVYVE